MYDFCTRPVSGYKRVDFQNSLTLQACRVFQFQMRDRYPCSVSGCPNQAKADKFCAYGSGDELLKCASKVCGYCASKSMCCEDHTPPAASNSGTDCPAAIKINLVVTDEEELPPVSFPTRDSLLNFEPTLEAHQKNPPDCGALPFKKWDDDTLGHLIDLVVKHQAHLKTSMSMESKWNSVRLEFYEYRRGLERYGWQALMRNYDKLCASVRETFIENEHTNLSAHGEPTALQSNIIAAIKAAKRQKDIKVQQKQNKELQQRKLADIENRILNRSSNNDVTKENNVSDSDAAKENDLNGGGSNGQTSKRQKFYTSSGGAFADLKEALKNLNPPELLEIKKQEAENYREDLALRREELELRRKESELLHKLLMNMLEERKMER